MQAHKIRHFLFTAGRVLLGIGLSVFLIRLTLKHSGADLSSTLGSASVPLLLAAVGCYGVVVLLNACRWRLLLNVQGIRLPFPAVLRLSLIGFFFNLVIPGAVSGDFVKMAYISRHLPEKSAESIFSIVVDRLVGMLGLFILATLMVLLNLPLLLGLGPEYRFVRLAAFTVGLGSVAGLAAVAAVEFRSVLLRLAPVRAVTSFAAARLPAKITALVVRVTDALEVYRRERRVMAAALGCSILVHVNLALVLTATGRALAETDLPLSGYFLTTQVANAIAAIPLTPSGFGLRDIGISGLFQAMHATPGKSAVIPVTQTLIFMFWGLVGGVVFIFNRTPKSATPPPAAGAP